MTTFGPRPAAPLHEAEDQYIGRRLGVAYAESGRGHSPLLVRDPTIVRPGMRG